MDETTIHENPINDLWQSSSLKWVIMHKFFSYTAKKSGMVESHLVSIYILSLYIAYGFLSTLNNND